MSVSDAAFLQFLKDPTQRKVILAELSFVYEAALTPTLGTVYLSKGNYRTGPSDTPANISYRDVIQATPPFERAVDLDAMAGMAGISVGTMRLANGDGSLDFLLQSIIDGREARLYLGGDGWARSDFRPALVAIMRRASATDDTTIEIEMGDQRLLMDASVSGEAVTVDGVEKVKPLTLGYAIFNAEPIETDSTALIRCFHDENQRNGYTPSLIFTDSSVRDAGVSLGWALLHNAVTNASLTANTGTETMTLATHGLSANDVIRFEGDIFAGLSSSTQYWVISAGLTASDFRVSATKGGSAVNITGATFSGGTHIYRSRFFDNEDGTFQLSSTPAGVITGDFFGVAPTFAPWVPNSNVLGLMYYLASEYGGLPSSQFDGQSFQDTEAEIGTVQATFYLRERANLVDLLNNCAECAGIVWGFDALGVMRLGVCKTDGLQGKSAAQTLGKDDMDSPLSCGNYPVKYGTVTVGYEVNQTIQREIASDLYRMPYRYTDVSTTSTTPPGAYATTWPAYHRTAIASPVYKSPSTADFLSAEDRLNLHKPMLQVLRCAVGLEAYNWNLGDVVSLTYPRYGYESGRNCRLAGIKVDLAAERVDLTLVSQMDPDTTTTSHA